MTVLFADLSGYTRLSREIDAEELHVLAGRFFDVVDAVVEGYGGTVRKHIGDCIMAVFGAPVAHSNDPERAVRAALDIQHQVTRVAARSGCTSGSPAARWWRAGRATRTAAVHRHRRVGGSRLAAHRRGARRARS